MPRCTVVPLLLALALPLAAQSSDSAYAGVQHRGAGVMGVDQEASAHVFEDLPDGGRILYRMRDTTDAAGTATIRMHLRHIAERFRAGDFTDPEAVHAMTVPGTDLMQAGRDRLTYAVREVAGGGEVRISTGDPELVDAVHRFLAFQRSDHRAPGHEGHAASPPGSR